MKKKAIQTISFLFCLFLSFSTYAQEKKLNPALYAGNWSFTVADAPYGYDKGTAKLFMEEDALKGEFKLGEAMLKVNSFTEKEDGYSCTVNIDGYPIDIMIHYKDRKLTGRADDGYNYYTITFTKVK